MGKRHHALDLVRGLAAVGVAIYHFLLWEDISHIQSMGTFSVYLFFILSALTMMMVYGESFKREVSLDAATDFFRNRIARLLPLLATIAALRFVLAGPTLENLAKAGLTGTALFGLHLPGMHSNSVGAWSLGIEALFYVVFPIAALIAGSVSLRALVGTTLFLIAGQQAVLFLIQPAFDAEFFHLYTTPLIFAPFFAIGFVIHRIGGERSERMLPVTLAILAAVMCFSLINPAPIFRSHALYLALTALASAAVFASYRSAVPAFLIPVAEFLGNISYSLYLTHWLPAAVWKRIADMYGLPDGVQFALFITSAIILAALVYKWLESPARKLLRGPRPAKPLDVLKPAN